jgi:acyl dehydratase
VPSSGIEWRLAGDLGRRYAAVSGDHNPIHLYGLTAKAFGFPRQIAHGMWSKARCVAMLEPRLPDAVRVDVAFKKPILLPSTVAFGSREVPKTTRIANQDWEFSLTSARNGEPHLLGKTSALTTIG